MVASRLINTQPLSIEDGGKQQTKCFHVSPVPTLPTYIVPARQSYAPFPNPHHSPENLKFQWFLAVLAVVEECDSPYFPTLHFDVLVLDALK